VEKEAQGTCHFAGEHTSQDFQGYLNGAVESGYRAADEILAALK
jgi:monoamine oxidase